MSKISDFIYHPPRDPFLSILYKDDHLAVLNKPAGLLSVPGRDPSCYDSLLSRLRQTGCQEALAVHRLDMDTSGLMVVSLTRQAASALGKAFELRQVVKEYSALVFGKLEGFGVIDLPLRCDIERRPLQIVDFQQGKKALTEYCSLEIFKLDSAENYATRLKLIPKTGRSHQLRVHLQSINHPILGDRFYGMNKKIIEAYPRLCLHACKLEFTHPFSKERLSFYAKAEF